jgi:hypothetical protein
MSISKIILFSCLFTLFFEGGAPEVSRASATSQPTTAADQPALTIVSATGWDEAHLPELPFAIQTSVPVGSRFDGRRIFIDDHIDYNNGKWAGWIEKGAAPKRPNFLIVVYEPVGRDGKPLPLMHSGLGTQRVFTLAPGDNLQNFSADCYDIPGAASLELRAYLLIDGVLVSSSSPFRVQIIRSATTPSSSQ